MLKVGLPRVAGAGRERAVAVADLDEVTQGVVRLVGVWLVGMVTREGRHLFQAHGELASMVRDNHQVCRSPR